MKFAKTLIEGQYDSNCRKDYNARLYDPALGRFLSVDPLISHPESTQGINPYSYVENNPLNRTDPTGEADCAGGANDTCKLGNIKTQDVQKVTVNKNGSVSVTMKNGNTLTSAAGSVGKSTMTSMAAGAMSKFGPSSVNMGNLAKALGTKNPNTRNNVPEHDVKNKNDSQEPSDVTNNTNENSDFAPHISVNHSGNRTDISINLTMSWNPAFSQKQVDEAKAGIEKYWSGTIKSDGQIYSIRTHVKLVDADPLIGSGHAGLLDMQLCAGCGTKWGGLTVPGGSTIEISEGVLGKEQWEIAVAHEFGHALGL